MVKGKILEAMVSMDCGKVEEEASAVTRWLSGHSNVLKPFVNGVYAGEDEVGAAVINPSTGEELAKLCIGDVSSVESAVSIAKEAAHEWGSKSGFERAEVLLKLAKCIEDNQKLLSIVEALDTGRNIKGIEVKDLPAAIQAAYYSASAAQLADVDHSDYEAVGIVGLIISPNCLLNSICRKVFAALSAGNAVVLVTSPSASLSSLLLAELAHAAGLPAGVFNVIPGDADVGDAILKHYDVNALHVIGSVQKGKHVVEVTAGTGKQLGLELGGKNPLLVFDSADLDSSCEAIWESALQGSAFGSRILVQESVYERFAEKLKARLLGIKVGNALDRNADFGSCCCKGDIEEVKSYVELARSEGAEVIQPHCPEGNYYPPTLILNSQTVSKIAQDPISFPVICVLPFRTAKEAIAIANNSLYGLAAGIFTENSALALEVAKSLKVGTIWINSFGCVDPAATCGGFKQSSNICGREGVSEFLKPRWQKPVHVSDCDGASFGAGPADSSLVKTIQAASAAQQKWSKMSGRERAIKLYAVADKIHAQKVQIVAELQKLTGVSSDDATKEVDVAVKRLYFFAAIAERHGGEVRETVQNALVIRLDEPTGVIGVVSPDTTPLAGFCCLIGCAVARGNFVLAVANKRVPKAVVDAVATLPAFKVISGCSDSLAKQLAETEDLQGLWYFGSYVGSKAVEALSARNMKRTWVNYGENIDWFSGDQGQGSELQQRCIQFKYVWFPIGDIFAN